MCNGVIFINVATWKQKFKAGDAQFSMFLDIYTEKIGCDK